MIKRLIHIFLVLVMATGVSAQVVSPLGYGLSHKPEKIAEFDNGLVAVCADSSQNVVVHKWNNHFWSELPKPPLPLLGSNADGFFEVVDAKEFDGDLYIATRYSIKNTPLAKNYVVKWSGSSWQDVSTKLINEAQNISKLTTIGDKIQCIGVFVPISGVEVNIAEFDGSNWTGIGNNIVRANTSDQFRSISVRNGHLYSTGNFTSPTGQHSLAVWNGSYWNVANYPAFIGHHEITGTYNNQIVVYGESPFESEKIKISNGTVWDEMSGGTENYTIQNIREFGQAGDVLFALGNFSEILTGEQFEILIFQDEEWSRANLEIENITTFHSNGSNLLLGGNFTDGSGIRNIGELVLNHGQIVSRVFYDTNGDCEKQESESWAKNYPIGVGTLIPSIPADRNGSLYLPVSDGTYKLNAVATSNYELTCPDAEIQVSNLGNYSGNVFGVKRIEGLNDLKLTISDNQSHSGLTNDNKQVLVCVENIGSTDILNSELMLHLGSSISNFASQKAYNSFTDKIVKYNVSLNMGDKECFYITFKIADEDEMVLTSSLSISNGEDDDNSNNTNVLRYKKGETEDNFKDCNNGEYIKEDEENLSYKIGFKNVGSSQVYQVKIVDILDTSIRLSALGFKTPFEDCGVTSRPYLDGNGKYHYKVIVSIDNINLQPSSSSDIQSKGYVDLNLRIRPDEFVKGLQICNTAEIYFAYSKGSFNEGITTNTVCSQVSDVLHTPGFGGEDSTIISGLKFGPIPVDQTLFINNATSNNIQFSLTNMLGQELKQVTINKNQKSTMHVGDLESGTYIIYANGVFAKKLFIK